LKKESSARGEERTRVGGRVRCRRDRPGGRSPSAADAIAQADKRKRLTSDRRKEEGHDGEKDRPLERPLRQRKGQERRLSPSKRSKLFVGRKEGGS